MNIRFEETPCNGISFDGRFIFKWNIDRLKEYKITILLKNMLINEQVSNLIRNFDRNIAWIIGFGLVGNCKDCRIISLSNNPE